MPLRILLIQPGWAKTRSLWSVRTFRLPPMALAILASLSRGHEVTIVDENVEMIPNAEPDLVGISAITPLAPRAYEIADTFREKGVPVIMGGVHPSFMPEEALEHANTVVIGEAEEIWPRVLKDVEDGRLRCIYHGHPSDLSKLPLPRRDLFKKGEYFTTNVVQTSRGCPFNCDFCSVSSFCGMKVRHRPIDHVIKEITSLGRVIMFLDDNIAASFSYAKELFKKLIPLNKLWGSQCRIEIAKDDELLRLAAESGCYGLFIGFESISQQCLDEISKRASVKEYKALVKNIHDYNISVEGAFIFGFDHDKKGIAKATVDFANYLDLDAVQFGILTPFPGTKLFERLESEGRILTYDWRFYDVAHVVFQPKRMSPEELENEFFEAYERFYGFMSIFSRMLRRIFSRHPIHLLELTRMNLDFRFGFRRPKFNK